MLISNVHFECHGVSVFKIPPGPVLLMLISNVHFECHGVSVFKIPPGPVSLANWPQKSIVWKGSMRLTEEEQTAVSPESALYMGLRLKLELYNRKSAETDPSPFRAPEDVVPWAEVWYNPFLETDLEYRVANDGSDTIEMTPESSKYYQIISQLPDTGYSPIHNSEKGFLLQVALGLQFDDPYNASSFSESLEIYRRHFRNFQEKFLYDSKLSALELTMLTSLTLPSSGSRSASILAEEDDDEFGSFVGSSYD
ncbi:hypothetical protein METBIDRAFT_176197 [Metschnikowia bicuspidata var. bicuspidata NRRL YB-4993]|uniref:Uncharacterized protein n=1 Tax=Metschnikowia bicuspidata var. bicuspidata NRRL YB-4993 TaxID=869754 RepID=A0A1A0HB89_9ASCO|nr:hypothetical protein METBIDRAFT_176197 [Metschnikowia bicuspidata var. bicuspidata NRRL YB-4993]OBA21142.1 hypothetical protein METBIDRAFT_176197 [Metschnikowia bicuspidata var. bicuspidata NRRL YB-4993]